MKIYSFRLKPGQDLKLEIEKFAQVNNVKAGFIITCVGGLQQAVLRMAFEGTTPKKHDIRTFEGPLEIDSLIGTVSVNGCHLHIVISDNQGRTFGGHLKENCLVQLTAEIVIGEDLDKIFTREKDDSTGFNELKISPRNKE